MTPNATHAYFNDQHINSAGKAKIGEYRRLESRCGTYHNLRSLRLFHCDLKALYGNNSVVEERNR